MDDTITAHEKLLAPAPKPGTFQFDRVAYDTLEDTLVLQSGPMAASVIERTPEGHTIRVDALENRVISVQIHGARERVRAADGDPLPVTIAPGQQIMLDPRDLTILMASGRFAGQERSPADGDTLAKANGAKLGLRA